VPLAVWIFSIFSPAFRRPLTAALTLCGFQPNADWSLSDVAPFLRDNNVLSCSCLDLLFRRFIILDLGLGAAALALPEFNVTGLVILISAHQPWIIPGPGTEWSPAFQASVHDTDTNACYEPQVQSFVGEIRVHGSAHGLKGLPLDYKVSK